MVLKQQLTVASIGTRQRERGREKGPGVGF